MATSESSFPEHYTKLYWLSVLEQLVVHHGLKKQSALAAIKRYKSLLSEAGVGNLVFHAPVGETAEGVKNRLRGSMEKPGLRKSVLRRRAIKKEVPKRSQGRHA